MSISKDLIHNSFIASIDLFLDLQDWAGWIDDTATLIVKALKSGHKLVLFGNGGSAADAQHIATELVGGFRDHARDSYAAIALSTDTSALTAIGNDYSFDLVFQRQVQALVNPGDVVIAISTSGNSKNVLEGAKQAKKCGALVIGFTGRTGGQLREVCDTSLCVPSSDTPKIQEAHITVGHILAELIEQGMK